ncbi:MAG: YetF domain-containing protein [Ignavibacteria bacterium]
MMNLLEIAGGSAIIYILVIVCLRVLGKKGLSELSLGDLVLIILIGEALGSLIPQENAFASSVTCIITLSVMNYIVERIVFKSKKIRILLEGKPVTIIKQGNVLKHTLMKERLTIESVEEAIRSNGLKSIDDVAEAVLETDGEISIIAKA